MVAAVLQSCLPRRDLTSSMLLPPGSEVDIDAGEVGVFGAFEIYRGKKGGHRMANLRVILR